MERRWEVKHAHCPDCTCRRPEIIWGSRGVNWIQFIIDTLQKTYEHRFPVKQARSTDPDTSHQAAHSRKFDAAIGDATFVYDTLRTAKLHGWYGHTDSELEAEAFDAKQMMGEEGASNMTPAREMLEECGFIRDSGNRRKAFEGGGRGIVWELVPVEEFTHQPWPRKKEVEKLDNIYYQYSHTWKRVRPQGDDDNG